MFCKNCGTQIAENARFCARCGTQTASVPTAPQAASYQSFTMGGSIGFSARIQDPAFAGYVRKSNQWAGIFAVILAVAAVIGFYIAGESSGSEMENPQSLFIGLGIGGMFLLIAFFQILGRKRSRTWDGAVIDKTVRQKTRKRSYGNDNDDYHIEHYTEYTVVIQDDTGRKHRLAVENDDTVFNYYQVGDRVRHHAGLNSYEKYDKSRDSIIFCNACANLCDIREDRCPRCQCPLLK